MLERNRVKNKIETHYYKRIKTLELFHKDRKI